MPPSEHELRLRERLGRLKSLPLLGGAKLSGELERLQRQIDRIGEEATETVLAAKGGDRLQLVRETADLWFHCLIMLARYGLGPADVLAELHRREGISGIDEKAGRAPGARKE